MSTPTVVVLGSLNADLVAVVDRQPADGETVPGLSFSTGAGGKGLNQAIACARAGAETIMIGAVGSDDLGDMLLDTVRSNNCNCDEILSVPGPSGVAIITVASDASNRIVVVPGANSAVTETVVDGVADVLRSATVLLVQLETPLDGVLRALEIAKSAGVTTILNPAPVIPLPAEAFANVDILVVNEHEAALLPEARGRVATITTYGSRGSVVRDADGNHDVPAHVVEAVDTTAAGDTYCGTLAANLASGKSLVESAHIASAAGALTATRFGAVDSIPTAAEVESFLAR